MTGPAIQFAQPGTAAPAAPAAATAPATTVTIDAAQLQELVARAAGAAAAAPPAAPTAWGALAQARPAAPPPPAAVAVPVKIDMGDRSNVKALLFFGPEHAGPGALQALLDSLIAAQVPVDVWRPRDDDGDRGGYGRRRGGWR